MLNIAIAGTGFGVQVQAKTFSQIADCRVVGLYGRTVSKTQKLAQENSIARAYTTFQELLNDPQVDIISIATPNYLHKDMCLVALKSNKHIILEKPAGLNTAEITELQQASKNYKKLIIVDHSMRFNPVITEIHTLLNSKRIGDVYSIHVQAYTNYNSNPQKKVNWMDFKKFGGGEILLKGTHLIDLIRYLFEMPDLAEGNMFVRKISPPTPLPNDTKSKSDVEETMAANIYFKNGLQAYLSNTLYSFGYSNFEIKIFGSKGIIFYDDKLGLRLSTSNEQPLTTHKVTDHLEHIQTGRSLVSKSFKYFAFDLVTAFNTNTLEKLPFCSLAEAFENMAILEKINSTSSYT